MEKLRDLSISGPIVMILFMVWLVLPVSAQVQQPGEEAKPEPLIRVMVKDLTVQGEQTPEAVKEAFNEILPRLAECIEAEYERARRLPNKLMLRINLNSNGKVVRSKLVDPPLKSLDTCIAKVMPQMQLAPSGNTITRVTVMLETRTDHLLGL